MWAIYEKNRRLFEVLFWIVVAVGNTSVNAVSVIADYQRIRLPLPAWEPWAWEVSSQVVMLLLLPAVIWFNRRFPLYAARFFPNVIYHLAYSVVYSGLHVAGMVGLRKVVYMVHSKTYEFGAWGTEFVYEYRKDLLDYIGIILIIYAYRFITSRLRGEAHIIASGEETPESRFPERLLVKKLGKEFIIRVQDIEWIEAAGNYMNLHVAGRVYPLRETMNGLESRLDPAHFRRIHRSSIVNLDRVSEILPLDSGDCTVRMQGGEELRLSRRYRDQVRGALDR